MAAPDYPPSGRAVPLIAARFSPLYVCKEPAAEKMCRKYLNAAPNGTAQDGIGRRKCDALSEETEVSITPVKVVFLCKIPITGPQFRSALNASCSYLQVLGSPTCPRK